MHDPYAKPRDGILNGLAVAAVLAFIAFAVALSFAGCAATPPKVIRSADKVVGHFRMIRVEGRNWDESTWDARLRAFETEACTVAAFVREGTIPKGTAKRCLADAKAAE